ncbi:MAG: hypothetical protein JNG88_01830 [Phycisphaerales bacterium]|nr:hypothetical protein [Phycisphaerales bacterium]
MASFPTIVIGVVVAAYWGYVGLMVLRVRRGAKGVSRVLIPRLRVEQFMWVVWLPLIATWISLPFVVAARGDNLPHFFRVSPDVENLVAYFNVWTLNVPAWLAALIALVALHLSIRCWRHMGRHWRMGIDPAQDLELLTDGPFSWARHPIYTLGMLIMLCTVIIIPSPAFLIITIVHIALLNLKSVSEERFLGERFSTAYRDYRATTGRLIPRWSRVVAALRGDDWPPPRFDFGPGRYAREPLDAFQRAMLSWEKLHPYNAVHAAKLSEQFDAAALGRAIRATAESIGIGDLHIAPNRRESAYSAAGHARIVQLVDSADEDEALRQIAAAELNTPFAPGAQFPFRWFAWNQIDGRGHWIVMSYRHVAADGLAAEAFLRSVLERYRPGSLRPQNTSVQRIAPAQPRVLNVIRRAEMRRCFSAAMRLHRRLRSSHKMPDERGRGDAVGLQSLALSNESTNLLLAACRSFGIGLNDALLAALACAIAQATPDRHTSRRRRRIALATMLSTRPPHQQRIAFGMWLADAVVVVDRPDASFDDVLKQIIAELKPWKADRMGAAAVAAMRFELVRFVWPLFGLRHNRRSYRKVFPICGGVSTMRVLSDSDSRSSEILRYFRAVPCGPAAPLALAATRHDAGIELALTHRLSSQSEEQARALLALLRSVMVEWSAAHENAVVVGTSPAIGGTALLPAHSP